MAITLIVSSFLLLAAHALFRESFNHPTHAFHVEEFEVRKLSLPPPHLSYAMAQHVSIHFKTEDLTFDLDLALNEFIFARDSKIYSSEKDKDGNPLEVPKEYRSYRGNGTIQSRGIKIFNKRQPRIITTDMVTLTFYPDERAHILVITPDDIFTLDRIELHKQAAGILFKGKNQGFGMSVTRLSDRDPKQITDVHRSVMSLSVKKNQDRRNLVIYFDNCWPGQSSFSRVASIGAIVDNKYYCKVVTDSDTAQCQVGSTQSNSLLGADLQSLINDASVVYAAQFKIYLRLGTVYLGANASSLASNGACQTMSDQLTTLKTWRASYYSSRTTTDSNTVFHLFTNCHPPPGTVGLAYIGVLCNAASGYSTGVVNRVYDETWLTFAHECGHNFGMSHSFQNGQGTTGGIMDYGDGIYQGEYQFEPGRKEEVCRQLTSALSTTYSGFLPVDRCLPQYNEKPVTPTSQPTAQPTRKPTNKPTTQAPSPTTAPPTTTTTRSPTKRPTSPPTTKTPTKRPTSPPTQSTTKAPSPTPSPIAPPTPRPTGSPTPIKYYARWYLTNDYGDCYPSCGDDSYSTEIIMCCASDLSTDNRCDWQITDETFCDPATRPIPGSYKCDVSPCTTTDLCGNNQVDAGEYCDYSLDSCCLNDCSGFVVSTECVKKNTKIDAAFTDRDGRAYIFQGPYYSRYPDFVSWYYGKAADVGYPKAIKGNFPIQQCVRDIASIVARPSNQLWVFCNSLEYVKVDLDNQLQLAGVYNAGTEWNLPSDFIKCGQINAAVGLSFNMLLFCQNIWISIPYTRTSATSTEVQVRSVSEFGYTLQNGFVVTAILYDRKTGYWAWFQGPENYVTMEHYSVIKPPQQSRSIFNNTDITNITDLDGQGGCYQDSCIRCEDEVCKECSSGYVLYGARCFNDSVLAYLECNEASETDEKMVDGGLDTLFTFPYTTGVSGDAMVFDGQKELKMKGLNQDVTDFSVSAYFYPLSLNSATFVTVDDRFYFSYESVDDTSFQVLVKIDELEFTCYVAVPMKLNEWNKIQVIVKDSIIWTGANGFFHMRAFESAQQGLDLKLRFETWSIGSVYNGIHGYLDEFILMDEGTQTSSSDNTLLGLERWQIALIGVGAGLLLVGALSFGIYKYTHRQKLREQVNDFDATFK